MSYRPRGSDFFEPVNINRSHPLKRFYKLDPDANKNVKYPIYLAPTKPEEAGKFRRFENPDHKKNDRGHFGDAQFRNLYPKGIDQFNHFDLSPDLGTEIDDELFQLSELTDKGRDDLALFLETRGLGVFRQQDFRDKGPQFAKEFGEYFGPLHVHPVSFSAENHAELLTTFRPAGSSDRYDSFYEDSTDLFYWHSDVSFEAYPSSFLFFVTLEAPPLGGDTVFIDLREAYRRLSPTIQAFFDNLVVIHSNVYQNKLAEHAGQPARVAGDLYTKHPLVRVHPVTGEKLLFFSRGFIQRVEGVKKQELDFILNFLVQHVTSNPEFQVRALHRGTDLRSVIAWDNRFLLHTATLDFLRHNTGNRHHYRITVLGERPYNDVIGDGDGNKDEGGSKKDGIITPPAEQEWCIKNVT